MKISLFSNRINSGSELKPVILNEASNEIKEQYLNSAKARRMLNWQPLMTLDEGLKRTISWYQDYFAE